MTGIRPLPATARPSAPRRSTSVTHHGVTLVDDYAWLRAPNWQDVMRDPGKLDPEIRAYLEAENAYTAQALAGTTELQATLFAEMKARLKEDDSTVPAPDGPFDYYSSYVKGGQYPELRRRRRGGGARSCLNTDAATRTATAPSTISKRSPRSGAATAPRSKRCSSWGVFTPKRGATARPATSCARRCWRIPIPT